MSAAERPTPYAELADVIANLPLLIREARRARGLSIRAAGRAVGVSAATMLRAEAGDDLNGRNLLAVLRWLDQTGDDA